MRELGRIDFGSIRIHRKALAEIVVSALSDIEGLSLPPENALTQTIKLFGQKYYPSVRVVIDKNNQVSLEVKVVVRYGLNISEIARHAQEVIREAVERTADIDLKDININVQGIERRRDQ